MKKFFKALALVLALALVIGVVPAQATSAKIKAKKTLYIDGAKGKSTDGKLESKIKSRVAIYKLAGDTKETKEGHTYKATIQSGTSVTKTKNYVYAEKLGKSVVEIFKDGESLGTSVITVKKNATADTLTITGFEDGAEVVCGVKNTITLPRYGVDSDERRLYVDGELQTEVEGQPRVYEVTFKKAGDHKVKFEAYQSEKLDANTTDAKEITVKAVMPKAVSAKQVSATSFAVEFEGSMEGLITRDDVTNQMIYYLIKETPVVTGVVKDVTVKDAVVTVEMYSKFNDATTYYFAYGDGDPISFKTASNKASEVASIEIDKTQTFNVDKTTPVKYYLKNADGVILDIAEQPVFTVVSGTAGWFTTANNIFFFEAGKVNIKASFVTGEFDEATSQYVEVTDTATLEGVVASTTKTGTKYSLAGIDDEVHQIRMKAAAAATLTVKYTYSDGDPVTILSTDAGYSLKSVDETIAAIQGNKVVPVNVGSTTIVLYKGDDVLDAFPIQVLEANKGATASVKLSKNTLNMNGTLKKADNSAYVDQIDIEYTVKDLDGEDYGNFTAVFTQVAGNDTATGISWKPADNAAAILGSTTEFAGIAAGAAGYKTFRIQVEVKDNGNNSAVLYKTVLTFTVGNEAAPNSYKLNATKAALDTSIKNWANNDPLQSSIITVVKTKTSSYGDFACGTDKFDFITNMNAIVATKGAEDFKNYVIFNAPSSNGQVDGAAAGLTEKEIKAFTATADIGANKAKAGTYTFSGYHVDYLDPDGDSVYEQANKSSLGTISVVISGTDAKAKATVINGKASDLQTLGVNGDDQYHDLAGLSDLIQVSWEGLTSLKTTDANFANARVKIVGLTAVTDNSVPAELKYYVRSVKVQLYVSTKAGCTTYYGEQTVDVKELFKDK